MSIAESIERAGPSPVRPRYAQTPDGAVVFDAESVDHARSDLFGPAAGRWQAHPAGRGQVVVIDRGEREWVLRHYRRGGLVGRIGRDRYVWAGLALSRPWREWHLIHDLYRQGFPVPRPIAARVVRRRWSYTADLITERLPAFSLWDEVVAGRVGPERWAAVGRCIRRFHDAGVYHADLNAHNILLGAGEAVFLIDFDRGRRRRGKRWKRANLKRLKRSLDKLQRQRDEVVFSSVDWRRLLRAYLAGGEKRRAWPSAGI
ncbi:MAG: 3-deoxy-D-manno-octulosonic acid kinase [Pseudomonadota bacterium]|nr:3-deoxy-D-manno-octulosonic acid kinase [Pseudomonadota bacterium]